MFADHRSPRDPAGTDALAGPAAALAAAVDALLAADPAPVGDDELSAAMVSLRRELGRLDAAIVGLTAAFDARQAFRTDGSRSAAHWIAARTRLPKGDVAGQVRLGRRLRAMPGTRAALRRGDIGLPHARLLAGLAAGPRTAAHFPDGEPALIDHATTLRYDDFERVCAHWRDTADPDGPEQRRGRDDALRRVDLAAGLDGVGLLDGYLTPLGNATVAEALARLERDLFDADWAAAREIHGDQVTVDLLARTGAQRRHDALVEMARRAMSAPADGRRPQPLVTVLVGYETFAGRVCELAGGTVVAPGALAELLHDPATLIERVVFDGPNRIVDVSTARSFRGILRRVLEAKQRRCAHPTCDVPAARCEGDHVVAWSHGGVTTQANGQLMCGPHNRWRHADAALGRAAESAAGRQPPATIDRAAPHAGHDGNRLAATSRGPAPDIGPAPPPGRGGDPPPRPARDPVPYDQEVIGAAAG